MALEYFSNFETTTLNGAINNSVTSINVTDGSVFHTTPNFRIKIEDEILLVTSISSNTLTVTRGVEGTTAVPHADQTQVVGMLLTAQSIANFRSDTIKFDLIANRDSVNLAGRLFVPSDGSSIFDVNDGTAWFPILNHHGNGQTIPLLSNFSTLINNNTFNSTQNGDIFILSADATGLATNTQSNNAVLKGISLPVTITAQFRPSWHPRLTGGTNNSPIAEGGLVIRQSTAGNTADCIVFGWSSTFFENQGEVLIAGGGSNGGIASNNGVRKFTQVATFWLEKPVWFQIVQPSSGTRQYNISVDGVNWITVFSELATATITPDQAGFFLKVNSDNAQMAYLHVSSYKET